ncbi:threonine ammonia-lyase IlvA [Salisediminibacterium halotolerans]|uniref:threonine ammonia-lyase IlvA n=1 Tax=Salisediminibacterium halotolerans TaxID=517425 RepID=UPI000EB2598D|nr:threonine ammonia-lyase IlvA [Salisediminibacterium halotolerans]RLJ81058.1 L-threonine ammonia-lyase [Actinophytocola xinjiangensis]RPE87852.1 L-threonine ammonia-lyase [Salisediminibacterium halotolerans]TWG37951.1 L-threonine ammonia-lyase [Salisediminibacterium halotolerans]GEL09027.1 L-threonine dehydratase [Salisediminibacterium halotolerans]
MERTVHETIPVKDILVAHQKLKDVVVNTPLQKDALLSEKYGANIYLKREDLQVVRSFKLRGAYHLVQSLPEKDLQNGVVCASAGNHAQGFAYACKALGVRGKIFMPTTTPRQKVSRVTFFGEPFVEVILTGDTFDDAYKEAMNAREEEGMSFIHPFNDRRTIAGQGTIGMEILENIEEPVSHIFMSIGGGGLISGVGSYFKSISPATKVVGVEPAGAPGMKTSLEEGNVVSLNQVDKFVDGASVKTVGDITFDIAQKVVDDIRVVPEGKVCSTILSLYNENAIVAEPAGALPIAALDQYKDEIKGKTIVCVISGGNNDIDRMQEIKERSLIYDGYKHYFIVNFPQRAGALREFMSKVLGEHDDITRFEYTKKNNRDKGPVLVGIELKDRDDYLPLVQRMMENGFDYTEINKDQKLFNLLI